MLIPWNTDAPVYYFPWATIGLIVTNIAVFAITREDADAIDAWMLAFGDGLHPLQWVSSIFLHGGFMHLLGNMIFLWTFGLVVEGKLGWWRFLPLYLGIGAVYGAIVQTAMLGQTHALDEKVGAIGASAAIYGLLAIAMVWAPSNKFECVILVVFRVIMLEVTVLTFAMLYLVMDFSLAMYSGFKIGTEMLHLTGAGLGAVAGFAMLRSGMIDCEGWDIVTVLRGRQGEREEPDDDKRPALDEPADPALEQQRRSDALEQARVYLRDGNPVAAWRLSRKIACQDAGWTLTEAELLTVIRLLHREKNWAASIEPMVECLKRFPERTAPMRLKLAQILLNEPTRPFKALAVLAKIPPDALTPEQTELRRRLEAHAHRMTEDADLEVAEGEEW